MSGNLFGKGRSFPEGRNPAHERFRREGRGVHRPPCRGRKHKGGRAFGRTFLHPAIVDVDVLVAGVAEAAGDHDVRDFADERVVDFTAEGVPRGPALQGNERPMT